MLGACRFRHPNVSLESSSSARRCADGGFTNYIRPTQMSQKVYAKPAAHTLAVGKSAFLFVFLCLFCISSGSARFVLIFDSWSITSSVQSAGHKDVIARWLTCIKNTWWTAWLILAFFHGLGIIDNTLPETNIFAPWKWMVGILLSFWDGLFSGAMLVSGRVTRSNWSFMANGNPGSLQFWMIKIPYFQQ